MTRAILLAHERQPEFLDALAGHGEADQAARVAGHEVDRVRGGELRGDDKIALVFPVLVIDQDEHPAVAGFFDQFLGAGDVFRQLHGHHVFLQQVFH